MCCHYPDKCSWRKRGMFERRTHVWDELLNNLSVKNSFKSYKPSTLVETSSQQVNVLLLRKKVLSNLVQKLSKGKLIQYEDYYKNYG